MPVTPTVKPWYKSRTVIVNALTAAVAVGTALAGQQIVKDYPSFAASLTASVAALNMALRFVTVLPIGSPR